MTWLWYSAHRDPTATAERAGEFYLRYLPGFRTRLPKPSAAHLSNAEKATTPTPGAATPNGHLHVGLPGRTAWITTWRI